MMTGLVSVGICRFSVNCRSQSVVVASDQAV